MMTCHSKIRVSVSPGAWRCAGLFEKTTIMQLTMKQKIHKYESEALKPLTDVAIIGLVQATNGHFEHSPLTLSDFNITFYDKRTDRYFKIDKGSTTVDVIHVLARAIFRIKD